MARKKVAVHGRAECVGDEGACRGDEPVDHHGPAVVGGGQNAPGDAADFKAAHLGKHIQPVGRIGPVHVDGAINGPLFRH